MITKDGKDTPVGALTPENYIVPRGEEGIYHALIEIKQFDPKTGRRISTPRVQKFGRKSFESGVRANLKKQGYDITILHDPNEWIKSNEEALAARKKEMEEARKKAEQERFDKAVAEAVAKALAAMETPKETTPKETPSKKK